MMSITFDTYFKEHFIGYGLKCPPRTIEHSQIQKYDLPYYSV